MRSPPFSAAVCVLIAACSAARAEDFVLLRNGNVMSGRVEHERDRVKLSRIGSEYWFDASDVATVEPSLLGLYQWRRDQINAPTAVEHLRLASWCIEQNLHAQASRELLEARTLAPRDPRVAAIERRLMNAAFQAPANTESTHEPRKLLAALTDDDLDQLPPGVLEDFTRHIQPMLVNNCTSSGCHQTTSQGDFRLNRDLLHGMADYRSTRANLAEVLQAIDHESPEQSPLLLAANGPHAGRTTGAFTGRHAGLAEKLREWSLAAAAISTPGEPNAAEPQHNASGVFGLVKAKHQRDQFIEQTSVQQPTHGLRDEFDPEVFNRRHRVAGNQGIGRN